MKITALNDFTKDEDDFQEENVQVSKEAQVFFLKFHFSQYFVYKIIFMLISRKL
jgi:hypothetical protein